ncbi:hypothetical protein CPK_ORF00723 [Chlamydia pneumoniae LPCoLN]|uniref:hypothetical protein n=1 Tax=Chlamydia pneumoniae TaxID=83558 RepID=UPI0001BD9CF6|nr:hypothetical protein [Chlamydia pneumoniae]ACZ33192.1 hypothetical protein CPK_ORF00723 [Chlamydia pneumoniae LPCoLN]ETR80087.1 hypothetical protein X556_0577 [Chlamydia pneumoniae B21]
MSKKVFFESYEDFANVASSWPKSLRALVQGRYFVDSELKETPYRIHDFKKTPIHHRLYRSLPIISTIGGIIRLIEAHSGPIHPRDKMKYRFEVLQAVIEILGLGVLILVFDIIRCFLAFLVAIILSLLLYCNSTFTCVQNLSFTERMLEGIGEAVNFLA